MKPVYDSKEKRHRCCNCRFMIWYGGQVDTEYYGYCICGVWIFDTWDDKIGHWRYQFA